MKEKMNFKKPIQGRTHGALTLEIKTWVEPN